MRARSFFLVALPLALLASACERSPQSTELSAAPAQAAPARITVFAAASTTDVMRELGGRYESATGTKVIFSFDSSSNLARQITAAAPADVFISADQEWMDDVALAGAIQATTREDLLGNDLVLIAPLGREFEARMANDFDFAAALTQITRIAVGDPAHVPAGRYARQALESMGWWSSLEPLLIPAQDVRAALRLVELGEADAGIVYSTDARRSDKVTMIAAFPAQSHEPIHYPIALCTGAVSGAAQFVDFLRTPESIQVFERAGFRVLTSASGASGP